MYIKNKNIQINHNYIPQAQNDWTAFLLAASSGHFDSVQRLVREGADIAASNSKRETALYLAACK